MDQKILGSVLILVIIIAALFLIMQPGAKETTTPKGPAEALEVSFTTAECDSICKEGGYEKGECIVPSNAESYMVKVEPCNQMNSVCYCYDEPEVPEVPEEPEQAELYCVGMPLSEAEQIAEGSECTANSSLTDDVFCNNITRTWWINLDLEKEGYSPACVVSVDEKTAEINWRCTGALP